MKTRRMMPVFWGISLLMSLMLISAPGYADHGMADSSTHEEMSDGKMGKKMIMDDEHMMDATGMMSMDGDLWVTVGARPAELTAKTPATLAFSILNKNGLVDASFTVKIVGQDRMRVVDFTLHHGVGFIEATFSKAGTYAAYVYAAGGMMHDQMHDEDMRDHEMMGDQEMKEKSMSDEKMSDKMMVENDMMKDTMSMKTRKDPVAVVYVTVRDTMM